MLKSSFVNLESEVIERYIQEGVAGILVPRPFKSSLHLVHIISHVTRLLKNFEFKFHLVFRF